MVQWLVKNRTDHHLLIIREIIRMVVYQILEISLSARYCAKAISACKAATIEELKSNGGNTSTSFLSNLNILHTSYVSHGWDARWKTK